MHWDTLTVAEQSALWVEEDELEMSAIDLGIERFRDQCQRQLMSQWPAARQLMASSLADVVDGVETARVAAESGRGMKGCQGWGIPFMVMDAGVLALATMACLFDGLTRDGTNTSLASLCSAAGERVEMEWHFQILKEEAPRLKAVMERRVKRWDRHAIRRARGAMGELGKRWPFRTRQRVGAKLVEIAVQNSAIFKLHRVWKTRRKSMLMVVLTDEATIALSKLNEHLEVMQPLWLPMIVPPNRWAPRERGGYRLLSPYMSLVIQKAAAPEAPEYHGDTVFNAVNDLQATPWRVNTTVLDTLEQVWAAGGGWGGIPGTEPIEMPSLFPTQGTDEEKTEWKKAAARLHQINARVVSKRLAFLQMVEIAQRFKERVFYFPHRLDFRGRIYPTPLFLQPQGNDVARGLLRFAEGKPLGVSGWRWLKIQYANCWGVDKVSFDEREMWAEQKLVAETITLMDAPPLEMKHLWAEADDPWQALATLLEIKAALMHPDGPAAYSSTLPVNVDGSNSGLQHFSAMIRDEEGGKLVNLVPSEQPMDIYSDVASVVKRMICDDTQSGLQADTTIDTLPADWLAAGITRKLCKRGTMTYCYGVTQQGLMDALIADGFVNWAENQYAATRYIGKKIWASIRECITGAEQVMDWLKKCAGCANKADLLLRWETPAGFRVLHPYLDAPTTRITCLSAEVSFRVYDSDAEIMPRRQRQALPPNFVHSMDACHLMMTVEAGTVHGIDHWMMIHDSFGTHACDVDKLNEVLREEFVKLYSLDILERFRSQVIEQTGHDPGPPPAMGSLVLEEVYASPYFFA